MIRSPRSRFAQLVESGDFNLAHAALLIAAEQYPQLSEAPYLHRLDLYAERVKDRLADETAAPVLLAEISKVLFQEEGLRGNTEAYYDPRNSFLNDVLDRRLGIPITLSIIYVEVGWRLSLPLTGVNFPGHFLVRYEGEALRLLIDPFQGGLIRFEDEAQDLLDRVYGGTVKLQQEYLRPASKRDILVRLLANLKTVYLNARDDTNALAAIERILVLQPNAADEIRDRAMALARTGRLRDALAGLEQYLDLAPGASDAQRIRMLISELVKESSRER